MILYKLGIVSDAFSISSYDVMTSFALFAIFLILAIFTAVNMLEESYPTNCLDEFLQEHRFLTFIITLALAAITAFMLCVSIETLVGTVPGTIVENRYILQISARNVEVKDDFKTIYTNEEDVEFSSILEARTSDDLPQDLLNDLRSKTIFSHHLLSAKSNDDFTIFSTKDDMNSQQVEAMRILSKHHQVIEINASKSDQSVKVLATIDSVEVTKEEENEENLTYHVDKIEMADAVETISRDSQSKSRDIKTVKLHISGKTSKAAKDRQSIEKLVE